MVTLGRWIVSLGLILVGVGLVVMAAEKFSFFRLGRLPGDIVYRGKHTVFYFPLATSLLLSVLLTLLFSLFRRR
ncbi:MAG: DUF2905 domain-containing protein [Acidobacteria bacterium]|nr:DUF2905 domain-containing protein [Acidobacteriota bacterium]